MAEPVKQTTKECPKCGNTQLCLLRSYNKKYCTARTCHIYIDWYLDEKQKPIQ